MPPFFSQIPIVATILLAAGGLPAYAAPVRLSATAIADVRCSAAFAIVAGRQGLGVATHYDPLGWRGREFMVQVGTRLIDSGKSEADVAAAMREAATQLQDGAMLDAIMPPCLVLLDATVPELIRPTLPQCVAIMRMLPGGGAGAGKLEAEFRAELAANGQSTDDANAILGAEATGVEQVAGEPGGLGRYDTPVCLELAKAD